MDAVCPRGNPALRTTALSKSRIYNALAPLRSFRRGMEEPGYDLAVPCDDLAAAHLHYLYQLELQAGRSGGGMATLLRRSLGEPGSLGAIAARSSLLEIAREEGIRVPDSAAIHTCEQLEGWFAASGLPAVLKADGTGGGHGVRIVNTRAESVRAFRLLSRQSFTRVLKRAIVNRDATLILPFLLRRRVPVNAQSFIPGSDATISISCWKGAVLASIAFEVLNVVKPNGPASVVRVIDNWQMSAAAVSLARRLNLSGFYGLDFRIDENNCSWLIEMNPRATQSSHLTAGDSGDLVGSLVSTSSGRDPGLKTDPPAGSVVAFFPNEWETDPASDFLRFAYHDVPWSEPDLVRMLMKKNRSRPWSGWVR